MKEQYFNSDLDFQFEDDSEYDSNDTQYTSLNIAENGCLDGCKNFEGSKYQNGDKTSYTKDFRGSEIPSDNDVAYNELTKLDMLKFNLQEETYPYFTDKQLSILLSQYGSVNKASYEGCLIKARNDSVSLGPINTVSNEKYWLRMAKRFSTLEGKKRKKTMRRADEF